MEAGDEANIFRAFDFEAYDGVQGTFVTSWYITNSGWHQDPNGLGHWVPAKAGQGVKGG